MGRLAVNHGRRAVAEVVEAKNGGLELRALIFASTHEEAKQVAERFVSAETVLQRSKRASLLFWIYVVFGGVLQLIGLVAAYLQWKG